MLQWFDHRNRPIHVLLTKADKLTRNAQSIALAQARRLIAAEKASWGRNCSVSLFSAPQRLGRDEAVEKIAQWWHLQSAQPEPKVAKKTRRGDRRAGTPKWVRHPLREEKRETTSRLCS